jgi:hypothetical protein
MIFRRNKQTALLVSRFEQRKLVFSVEKTVELVPRPKRATASFESRENLSAIFVSREM